jgi:hypothetical protein
VRPWEESPIPRRTTTHPCVLQKHVLQRLLLQHRTKLHLLLVLLVERHVLQRLVFL